MCDSQKRNLVRTGNSGCLSFLINSKILLWLLLMTWHGQLKKLSWRNIPNLLWGRLGPKAVRSPKYMNETNFFLQPKYRLGEFSYVNIIFLMGFTKVAVQLLDLSLNLISLWALNALQALWAVLRYDL